MHIIYYIHIYCLDTAKQLSDNIKAKLKALGFERYKYIVQVLIGERRDQGVRMGTRCFWDSATDNQVGMVYTSYFWVRVRVSDLTLISF